MSFDLNPFLKGMCSAIKDDYPDFHLEGLEAIRKPNGLIEITAIQSARRLFLFRLDAIDGEESLCLDAVKYVVRHLKEMQNHADISNNVTFRDYSKSNSFNTGVREHFDGERSRKKTLREQREEERKKKLMREKMEAEAAAEAERLALDSRWGTW